MHSSPHPYAPLHTAQLAAPCAQALTDIVKPTGRRWDDPEQGEWARLVLDGLLHGDIRTQGKLADLLEEDDVRTYEDEAAAVAWVRDKFPPAVALVNCGGADSLTQQGWAKEPAETFRVLEVFGKAAISRALKQAKSPPEMTPPPETQIPRDETSPET